MADVSLEYRALLKAVLHPEVEVRQSGTGSGPAGDPVERAAAAAALGLGAVPQAAAPLEASLRDPDARVRTAALGALVRIGAPGLPGAWRQALADPDPRVRTRACDLAPAVLPRVEHARGARRDKPPNRPGPDDDLSGPALLVAALSDADTGVIEAAAWALGELGPAAVAARAVARLAAVCQSHADPLVREAAVAALGSLGDPGGLPAVLHACSDRAAVRRRAVMALAAFSGPEVEAALEAASSDRDWQVRQAAEDLLGSS